MEKEGEGQGTKLDSSSKPQEEPTLGYPATSMVEGATKLKCARTEDVLKEEEAKAIMGDILEADAKDIKMSGMECDDSSCQPSRGGINPSNSL